MAVEESVELFGDQLAGLFKNTLLPDEKLRHAAELQILQHESFNRLYGLAVLNLTSRSDLGADINLAAAIAFKNYVKRYWRHDETSLKSDKIEEAHRKIIKDSVTTFMINSPPQIQLQFSEVIGFIGETDFPEKWPYLIHLLKEKLETANNDYNVLQGILHTAHSIFLCYRHKLQSDELWSEIKLVVTHFAPPLTEKFKCLVASVKSTENQPQFKPLYQSILLCTKIYHDLISQDLPEYLEERVSEWLTLFLDLLVVNEKINDAPGVIEDLKAEICEIASLIVQRYADIDHFQEYTQKFAQNIWNLLVTTDQDLQYDTLVCTAVRFLITVAERPESRTLFQDANVLNLVCQRVIIPNLTFREIDEELFEDDPDGYIAKEVAGQDIYSRRQTACNLLQVLGKFLEADLINVLATYIDQMLKSYSADKVANWKHKDLAIFLYSAMAIKGSTREHGTVSISQHVNVEKFFEDNIMEELTNKTESLGSNILKVDALRYIDLFRNYISLKTLNQQLPLIIEHIRNPNVVVRSYACLTLEKLLTMRDPSQPKTTAFKPENFEPFLSELVSIFLAALEMQGSLENDHIMKALMRLFAFTKPNLLVQFLPIVVPKLTTKLGIVARNPSKPYFNHYLFETLALTIRAACCQKDNPAIRDEFEKVLFNMIEIVVAQDVQEFIPYVLQLLNLILKDQTVGAVSERFLSFFQELLSPNLWERAANIPPLTELMITYVAKIGQIIITQDKLVPLLGIFQKLIASKATDHDGISLLQAIMIHLPPQEVDARIKEIFMLIFQRLTGSKTIKFVKNSLVCFSLYCFLRGPEVLASAINQLQDKMFSMVLEKLYLTDVKKVTGPIDRRICLCGMIRILSQLPFIDNGAYNNFWAQILLTIVEIFEEPQQAVDDEDYFIDITETLDFEAKYSKLLYSSSKRDDPTHQVGDMKLMLSKSLSDLSTKMPGFVGAQIQTLNEGVITCVKKYCQMANVTIS